MGRAYFKLTQIISILSKDKVKNTLSSKKFHYILIILLGLILYANTFNNAMFWDDNDFILNNSYIKSWLYLPKYFSQNVIAGTGLVSDYWRPLLMLVFSLEWSLWADWNGGYHIVNTIFHITCGLLTYNLVVRLFKNRWVALVTSCVFILHPLQTEAVSYANSLGDSLSTFFLLLSYIFFDKFLTTKNRDYKIIIKSSLFFTAALMSKETAVVGAPIILTIYLLKNPILKIRFFDFKNLLKNTWVSIFIVSVYFILRASKLNFRNSFNLYNEQNEFTSNIFLRVITFFKIFYNYLSLIFIPINLHMERTVQKIEGFLDYQLILGVLLFSLILFTGIRAYLKKQKIIWFGATWFLIALIPVSNIIVPINGLIYEHWMYSPMIGFSLFLAGLVKLNWNKYLHKKQTKILFITSLVLYLSLLSIKTMQRNNDWEDPIYFYQQTLSYSPNNYKILNNLGMEYAEKLDHDNGIKYYNKAIYVDPTNPVAYHNLGNSYYEQKNYTRAEGLYIKALDLDPKFVFSKNALIKTYATQDSWEKLYGVFLGHEAESLEDFIKLYQLATQLQNYGVAQDFINKAVDLAPNNLNLIKLQKQTKVLSSP